MKLEEESISSKNDVHSDKNARCRNVQKAFLKELCHFNCEISRRCHKSYYTNIYKWVCYGCCLDKPGRFTKGVRKKNNEYEQNTVEKILTFL